MFAARNMLFAGSSAFDPLSLSPALWLDGSDASTLYDATTGGSLVAADGAVARWEDKSGNGRHATQATAGARPLRKGGIQNGKDVVRFDGINDSLGGALQNFSAYSVFAVFQSTLDSTSTTAYARIFSQRAGLTVNDYDQTGHYIPIIRNALTASFGSWASIGVRGAQNATTETTEIRVSTHTGSQIANFRNGVASSTYSHTLGTNGAVYYVGGQYTGSPTPGDGFLKADIAEILVFPTALSTADRQQVENYLNAKWAIY